MAKIVEPIDELRVLVKDLLVKCDTLERENKRLSELCAGYQLQLSEAKAQMEQEKQRAQAVVLAQSLVTVSGSAKVARARVNSLLRDIDRCISLVNR